VAKKKTVVKLLCVYCRKGVVEKLPTLCPVCGKKLTEPIRPEMKLTRLVDLGFRNGVQFNFTAVPVEKKPKKRRKA
jgi:predicted amidophosphoribosyltransferase